MDEELLDEQDVAKALGQFKLMLGHVMEPLRLYGQATYVDQAAEQIVTLAWQLHWKLEGLDIPFEVEELHW